MTNATLFPMADGRDGVQWIIFSAGSLSQSQGHLFNGTARRRPGLFFWITRHHEGGGTPAFAQFQGFLDRSWAEERGGHPASAQSHGMSGQEQILHGGPHALVSHELFQTGSVTVGKFMASLFTQADQKHKGGLPDPLDGLLNFFVDYTWPATIFLQISPPSLRHCPGEFLFPLLSFENHKTPGLGIMRRRRPAGRGDEFIDDFPGHSAPLEFSHGPPGPDDLLERFHFSHQVVERIPFYRHLPCLEQPPADFFFAEILPKIAPRTPGNIFFE